MSATLRFWRILTRSNNMAYYGHAQHIKHFTDRRAKGLAEFPERCRRVRQHQDHVAVRGAHEHASTSDVVRDLIRTEQEQEKQVLLNQFRKMEADGSNEAEPAAEILALVKKVKKGRRAA